MSVELILSRLDGVKRERDGQWAARCPAHEDGSPSLAVKSEGGKTLLYCHAGCKLDAILGALRIEAHDLFEAKEAAPTKGEIVARYAYNDEQGGLLYEVVRYAPKDFRQRAPDGRGGWSWSLSGVRRVLYKLPELIGQAERPVIVVEGEKDAETLLAMGFLATCCAGGAKSWKHVAEQARKVFADRKVVVIPDNDEPGRAYANEVIQSAKGSARSVRLLVLDGLGPGGDVSDWVRDGGTAEKLKELLNGLPTAGLGIVPMSERLAGEESIRLADAAAAIPYNVGYLDDALGGIMPRDLVVLTARPGAGKTHLAGLIAERAAVAGKRVLGMFLEADEDEIERRMLFRVLAQIYADGRAARAGSREPARIVTYGSWLRGEHEDILGGSSDAAKRALVAQLGDRLSTVYRGDAFTIDDVEARMLATCETTDLYIIDHLHYVDTPNEKNEIAGITAIMTRLRSLTLRLNRPILLVAHLRKESQRPSLVPSLSELHGSSNVVRIATQVIALSPAPAASYGHLAPTFIQVLKSRRDGVSPLVARSVFDGSLGHYRDGYELGRIMRKGQEEAWEKIEDMPWWAKRAFATTKGVRS